MEAKYPAPTLASARNLLAGKMEEIQHLMKGDDPAAWDMIRGYAEEMVEAGKVAHLELAYFVTHRNMVPLVTGNDAMRAERELLASDLCSPEEDAAFEALAQETAQIREAQRIDAAHPVTFDMASFAARSLGLKKEA